MKCRVGGEYRLTQSHAFTPTYWFIFSCFALFTRTNMPYWWWCGWRWSVQEYLILCQVFGPKKNMSSVGIRTTRQWGHARSRISATCKSSSVIKQIVILYIPTIMLHSEIHWYSLYVYFFCIALRRLIWPRPAPFFSFQSLPCLAAVRRFLILSNFAASFHIFSSHLFLVFQIRPHSQKLPSIILFGIMLPNIPTAFPDCICYVLYLSQLCILPTKCVCTFCVTLRINSYYFRKQH